MIDLQSGQLRGGVLDLLPGDRRRHGGARQRADAVGRDEGLRWRVAEVDEDPVAAALLGDLEGEAGGVAAAEHLGDRAGEVADLVVVAVRLDRGDDVEAAGAGGLDEGLEADRAEHRAEVAGAEAHLLEVVVRGIEVEDDEVRAIEAGAADRADVEGDRVLVGEVEEGRAVVGERVDDRRVALAGDGGALHPARRLVVDPLLVEAAALDAAGEAVEGEGALAEVSEHPRLDGRVVVDEVALGDPPVGEEDLVGRAHAQGEANAAVVLVLVHPGSAAIVAATWPDGKAR